MPPRSLRRRASTNGRRPDRCFRRNPPCGSLMRSKSDDHEPFRLGSPAARDARSRRFGGTKPRLIEDRRAIRRAERRHHPETGAIVRDRLDQRLAIVLEMAADVDVPIFVPRRGHSRPSGRAGRRDRSGVDPLVDTRDERKLPRQSMNLPHAEGDQRDDTDGAQRDGGPRERRPRMRRERSVHPGRTTQGILRMSCMVTGIMFALRWYITQIDPERVMPRSTMVNISARRVQPPSDVEFMCRK